MVEVLSAIIPFIQGLLSIEIFGFSFLSWATLLWILYLVGMLLRTLYGSDVDGGRK